MFIRRCFRASLFLLSPALLLLAGCGMGTPAGPTLNVASDALSGRMFGGKQPVVGATVSVYEVGSTGYGVASTTAKASTTTDSSGFWSLAAGSYTCTAANTPMYVVASGGNPGAGVNANSYLMALIPQCGPGRSSYLWINEVTTAASVLAAGQFIGTGLGAANATPQIGGTCTGCATGTYNAGLVAAFSNTYPQLVNNANGTALASSAASGLTITREDTKLNSIANVLAACVNSTGQTSTTETTTRCGQIFTAVNATSATPRPSTTIQAALEMTLFPYYNVSAIFNLSGTTPPYAGLSSTPNDWTLGVSYTSASFGLGIAGSATSRTSSSLDIDATGRVWFPTNTATSHGIGYFDPFTATMNGPYGTTALKPQYVAVDTQTTPFVWTTDVTGGSTVPSVNTLTLASSTVSLGTTATSMGAIGFGAGNFTILGALYSGSYRDFFAEPPTSQASYQADLSYGTTSAATGWSLTNEGINSSRSYSFLSASGSSTVCSYGAFEIQSGNYKLATVGSSPCFSGGALTYSLTNGLFAIASTNQVCYSNSINTSAATQACVTPAVPLNLPEGIVMDGAKNLWLANSGNASVSTLATTGTAFTTTSTLAYLHNSTNGNTLTTPFGIAVDGSGNVWVSNAGCVTTTATACTPGPFVLSELIGAAAPTITPLSAQNAGASWGSKPTK